MTAARAVYFDGRTSRRFNVSISIDAGKASIRGDIERDCPVSEVRIFERMRNAPGKLGFPDGAYLEVADKADFDELLSSAGHSDSAVVRMQQSWRGAVAAAGLTLAIMTLGYFYGLPAASEAIAKALPEKVERNIGRETLSFLDSRMLAPSLLPQKKRDAIVARFNALRPPRSGAPGYEIVFRKSAIGANAFALPSGQIVLTDEIIKLVGDDDAVMAILAHELGHLHERHLMRRIIQTSAIGVVTGVLFGDVSMLAANVSTLVLDLEYSRTAEREADDYAIAMLKENGIVLSNMIEVFEKLEKASPDHNPYSSSHPATVERIERIRQARRTP